MAVLLRRLTPPKPQDRRVPLSPRERLLVVLVVAVVQESCSTHLLELEDAHLFIHLSRQPGS